MLAAGMTWNVNQVAWKGRLVKKMIKQFYLYGFHNLFKKNKRGPKLKSSHMKEERKMFN